MKYVIVSTWNGEGYSSSNTIEVKEFNNDNDAHAHIKELADEYKRNSVGYGNEVEIDLITEKGCFIITHDDGDDQGSFQCHLLHDDSYGVVIQCNVNEVMVVDESDYKDILEIAINQADKDEIDEIDLNADEIFIGAYDDDYDYQFIKIK
jgi:hypothetical protein